MTKSVLEVADTKLNSNPPKLNWFKIVLVSFSYALMISAVLLMITAGILGGVIYLKYKPELASRNLSLKNLIADVKLGWAEPAILEKSQQNWLILGIDSLGSRGDVPPLTDTILIAAIKPQTATINLLSLPRDLWLDDVKTKINSLYAYGIDRNPNQPTQLVTQTLSTNLGLPIHKTLVISLDQLENLIDKVGGVEINVPAGFTDSLFPKPEVDIKIVHDPKLLYETVVFEAGPQKMSGSMVLKYIRSRHSGDTAGTDIARGERQQLVILSLIKQLANLKNYQQNPLLALDLWQWYEVNFQKQIQISELISLFKPMIQTKQLQPQILRQQLTVREIDKATGKIIEPGVIFNPVVKSNQYLGQWVYVPTDIKELQSFVNQKIYQ